MISQFISPYDQRLLGELNYKFPEHTQAVGRLDFHSEGLLILTTDKSLTRKLLHPEKKHARKYLVLVEKTVSQDTVNNLQQGIEIEIKGRGKYLTQNCSVQILLNPPKIPARNPEYKEYFPHTWLEFTLTEGKNRQIRKMCKTVRHNCKRLIRTQIEDLKIDGMLPGEVREIEGKQLFELLKIQF